MNPEFQTFFGYYEARTVNSRKRREKSRLRIFSVNY